MEMKAKSFLGLLLILALTLGLIPEMTTEGNMHLESIIQLIIKLL